MERMHPCPECRRHLRASEARCPFCHPRGRRAAAVAVVASAAFLAGCPSRPLSPVYGAPEPNEPGPSLPEQGPLPEADDERDAEGVPPADEDQGPLSEADDERDAESGPPLDEDGLRQPPRGDDPRIPRAMYGAPPPPAGGR